MTERMTAERMKQLQWLTNMIPREPELVYPKAIIDLLAELRAVEDERDAAVVALEKCRPCPVCRSHGNCSPKAHAEGRA